MKLYRFNEGAGTFTPLLGGAAIAPVDGSPLASMATDGNHIYIADSKGFSGAGASPLLGRYDPIADTFTTIAWAASKPYGRPVWDFGSYLYILNTPGTAGCARYHLITQVWESLPSPSTSSATDGYAVYNGYLYRWQLQGTAWQRLNLTTPVSWETLGAGTTEVGAINGRHGDHAAWTQYGGFGSQYRKYDFVTNSFLQAVPTPGDVGSAAIAYETAIQGEYFFYESDGVTLQPLTERLGGDTMIYYAGQDIAAQSYWLEATKARGNVTLQIVPDATRPLGANAELSLTADGAGTDSLSMGAFTAGQKKQYFVRASIPGDFTPGLKQFAVRAYNL
jgi:hypothetical protein